jgi:hypothetical protein
MNTRYLILVLLFVMALGACKKEENKELHATLRVMNAWTGQDAVKLNVAATFGASIFTYPKASEPATITVFSADEKQTYFSGIFTLKPAVYSMYLSGTAITPDTVFREETDFPYVKTDRTPSSADSVSNIRFVNLSPTAIVLKIVLKDAQYLPALPIIKNVPSITEPTALSYKQISPWSKYPARAATRTVYNFEVRNAATNELLLANYSLTLTPSSGYFKNISLVIKGAPGGTGKSAFGILQSNFF